MSARTARRQRQQATSSDQAFCGTQLTPVHRISVYTVILLVVLVLVGTGRSTSDAIGLVMAAGAASTQVGSWLSGQRPVDSPGGAR